MEKLEEEVSSTDILSEYTSLKSAVDYETTVTLTQIYVKQKEDINPSSESCFKDIFKTVYFELTLNDVSFYISVSPSLFYSPEKFEDLFNLKETDVKSVESLLGTHLVGYLDEGLETFSIKNAKEKGEPSYSMSLSLPTSGVCKLSEINYDEKSLNNVIRFNQLYSAIATEFGKPIQSKIESIEELDENTACITILIGETTIEFEIEKSVLYRDYEFINSTGEGLLETAVGSIVLLLPKHIESTKSIKEGYTDVENYWVLFSEQTYQDYKDELETKEKSDESTETSSLTNQRGYNLMSKSVVTGFFSLIGLFIIPLLIPQHSDPMLETITQMGTRIFTFSLAFSYLMFMSGLLKCLK